MWLKDGSHASCTLVQVGSVFNKFRDCICLKLLNNIKILILEKKFLEI